MAIVAGTLAGLATSNYVAGITTFTIMEFNVAAAIAGAIVSDAVTGALADDITSDIATGDGILVNKASNNAPLPVVYGQRKVGGTRVFVEATGIDNEYLHVVIAVSEGEINSFENVYLNDIISTDSRFDGVLNVYTHNGSDTQTVDSNLTADVNNWTSNHRLQGTAYLYAKLKFDQDAYSNGLPTFTVDIKGTKVFDPRTSATAWSDNPALCIRDYLTNTRYGRGIESSLIDDTSFNAAANYCEETVAIGGQTKERYTCNGVVDTSQGSMDILKRLLTACRGFLVFSGGKYKLVIDKPETAVFTFSEDNIVGAWSINLGNKNNQFNRIRTNFFNPDRQWQSDIAVVDSAVLRTQDNGLLLEKTIELPFTSDIDRAKMITTINLNQSRQGITCEFTATIEGLKAEVGDVVFISHNTTGWSSKPFRVMRITLQNNDEVRVLAFEYDVNAYDFGTIQESDGAPNTNLPDTSAIAPPVDLSASEELYITNTSQGAQVRANLSWAKPADAFIVNYDVEYKNGAVWEYVTSTKNRSAQVNNLGAGTYYFRVRAVNTVGVRSDWNTTSSIVIYGLTTPPDAISNLSVRAIDGSCHLQWDRATDIDVLHGGFIRIRHTPMIGVGIGWANGVDLGESLAGTATNVVLPLLAGTYMAKAVDSAGNFSDNAVLAVTTTPNILDFNTVSTITEHPAFSGAKEDTIKSGSVIRLDGAPNFILMENGDSFITESSGEYFETEVAGTALIESYGEYYFSNDLDLGEVYTSRVSINMEASGYVASDVFDNRADNIDTWANFDGEPSDAVTVQLQIRTTEDNPASSPTWTSWQPLSVGDYRARAFEFRVIFNSTDSSRNIDISVLEVIIDMPDRNERAQSIAIPISGSTITYANPFKDIPMVGITAQNMGSGDRWALTNQTDAGFDIEFFNSAGSSIARNINWIATGYGRRIE